MRTRDTDILIIGAGIAGAALACALRDSGLDVMLVEKRRNGLDTARGDHLQPRTVDTLDKWGVLAAFLERGAQRRRGSVWYSADGEVLLHSDFEGLDLQHPYYLFLNHEAIGDALLDAALASQNASIVRPIRNWWCEPADGQRAVIRIGREQGADLLVRARVVAGADGRASRTRSEFGIEADTHSYERPIAVLFGHSPAPNPDNYLAAHLSPGPMVAVIPRADGGVKVGVSIERSETRWWRQASSKQLEARLRELAPDVALRELRFADIYPPVFLRARRWVSDNVVLIGDACHAMHPARSQGMNTSIRCIDALAQELSGGAADRDGFDWRLALQRYETTLKPGIDAMLEKNHQHGLEMDVTGDAAYRKSTAMLKAVATQPAVRRAFALNAAGYS